MRDPAGRGCLRRSRYACRPGFTLLETLLVLGLIALLAGLTVVASSALFEGIGKPPLRETLTEAIREARYQAALNKDSCWLRYDREKATFAVIGPTGETLATFRTGLDPDKDGVDLAFHRVLPARANSYARKRRPDLEDVDAVLFHPDRSSIPFAVTMAEQGELRLLYFDPFSDSELPPETYR